MNPDSGRAAPTDGELLEMAMGAGPEEVPGGWEALAEGSPELADRFAIAAQRGRLISRTRAALDGSTAGARALSSVRRAVRGGLPRLELSVARRAPAMLGPGGDPHPDDHAVVVGSQPGEFLVEVPRDQAMWLQFEAGASARVELVGTTADGVEHPLQWRPDGAGAKSERWVLREGEAPVVIRCRVVDADGADRVAVVVLLEADAETGLAAP
jgi:hypothetical protein